jgi:hypothetical protein
MAIKKGQTKDFGSPQYGRDYFESVYRRTYKQALDTFAEKHSEMMKPYAYNDFPSMLHWYPDPDPNPSDWDWNPPGQPGPTTTIIHRDPQTSPPRSSADTGDCNLPCGATITDCSKTYRCDASKLGVDFQYANILEGTQYVRDIRFFSKGDSSIKDVRRRNFKTVMEIDWESNAPKGSKVKLELITLHYDGVALSAELSCIVNFILNCCDTSTPVAYDRDNSADTVAPNNSASVAITGSGTPFTWAISGTGTWSLTNSETAGLTNTVNAGGDACGSATITITDCDGNTATGYIRSTGGQWSAWTEVDREEAGNTQCVDHTTCSVSSSSTTNRCGGYSDKYQWRTLTGISGDCSCSGSTTCSTGSGCPTDGGICYNAITVSDGPCSYSPTNFGWCYVILERREWECVP